MSNNISSNGLTITITIPPFAPLVISHVSADADVWSVPEIETGEAQTLPDGKAVFWGKNTRIEPTLTLSGASQEAKILADIVQSQQKLGKLPAIIPNVSVVVYNEVTGEKETYIDGIMKGGSVGQGYGNEKKGDRVFNFSFTRRI